LIADEAIFFASSHHTVIKWNPISGRDDVVPEFVIPNWLWNMLWFVVVLPLIYGIGIVRRVRARRRSVKKLAIKPEGLLRTLWKELACFVSDPKLADKRCRQWAVGDRSIGTISISEGLSTEERIRLKLERLQVDDEFNAKLGIGPEAGDLLEGCPLCGHWLATRSKPKTGDRDAFSCEKCGKHDLSGAEITIRQQMDHRSAQVYCQSNIEERKCANLTLTLIAPTISEGPLLEIADMVTAFIIRATERTAETMLEMILNYGHFDDDGVLRVQLEA